jgi:hypothetical protein
MTGVADAGRSTAFVRFSWQSHDAHRLITVAAVLGVAAAGVMAVVGLPPIDLHGPLHYVGIMDPLCGGTRAARYTMRGEWSQAWRYNPLGILAVVGASAAVARAVVGILAGRWLSVTVSWTPRRRRLTLAVVLAVVIVLEVRQQLLAELLTGA